MTIEPAHVIALIMTAGGVIAYLFRMVIAAKDEKFTIILQAKDAQIDEERALKKTYAEIAQEAVKSNIATTNYYRAKEGKAPMILPVPVIAEGNSPPSATQQEVARLATLRATMVTIKELTNQEPRKEPSHLQ